MTDRDQFAAQVRADALTRLVAVQEMQRRLQGLVGQGGSPVRRGIRDRAAGIDDRVPSPPGG
jgi:hypothetical protein